MKKLPAILIAGVLLSALFVAAAIPASAKKKGFTYLSMTLDHDSIGNDQYIRWIIPWDEIFENGKTYTFYANVMFENCKHNGGSVYVNYYAFDDMDACLGGDFNHLSSWFDFARWGDKAEGPFGEWKEFTYSVDPTIRTYGSPAGESVNVEAVWISVGFYQASGTVNVREVGVKDDTGKIIYSQSFEYGLDFNDAHFLHSPDIVPETEGETWRIISTDKPAEESSEPEPEPDESSEPEPEPDESSEAEPEPDESSEAEPEPDESSEAEPEPVESSEEPQPAESSEEPQPTESAEEPSQPAESAETSPAEKTAEGPGAWLWILIGAIAFAVVLAVVLILVLRKKKA